MITKMGHQLKKGDVLVKHTEPSSPYVIVEKGGTIQAVDVTGMRVNLKIGGKSYEMPATGRYVLKGE